MSGLDDTLDDLDGFGWIPGMQQILDGIDTARQAAADGRLTLDATQTLLSLLGNDGQPDLMEALAGLAAAVTDPDTNPTLTVLDDDTAKTVRHHGELHTHAVADTPRHHTLEAAALISEAATTASTAGGRCPQMTDAEREELSRKVADANRQSQNRPR